MKILGIGESIIDSIHIVEDTNVIPSKTQPDRHVGGSVLSALVVLSRLGIDCTFVTSLGNDAEGRTIRKTVKEEHISLRQRQRQQTKTNTILVDKHTGKRTKIRGNIIHTPITDLTRSFIRRFDLIIIDRHERQAFYDIVKHKKSSTKILIDPSTEISPFTMDMIHQADYPILPIESLIKIGHGDIVTCMERLYTLLDRPIVVTASDMGSMTFDGFRFTHISPYKIHTVDDLGAGDVFRGAFAYGIVMGWSTEKSASFGNYVASLQCTKLGNISAIPSAAEMKQFEQIGRQKKVSMPMVRNYFSTLAAL